ncbi:MULTISPECIES: MFS transporter [Azorhizobium]|nr:MULTISPECIES: MFS transporter [Azorhizobium]TDT99290.1 MHS family alpha-ketoglutarate permease-like MFS transporter [Azorhizobium sp. AG788]
MKRRTDEDFRPVGDGYDTKDTVRRVKAILVGSTGNLIEWYDVYVFAAFQLYFAPSFFADQSPARQQIFASIVFALGFLARPFGSLLFGAIADRYGRRISLTASVLLMCFGSLIIACTPSATQIGIAAPILLTVARLLQGLSQGGEYGASATYLSEMSHPNRRGFYSGVWYVTLIGGQLMAVFTLLIMQKLFLSEDQIRAWGWRIPFFIGAALAVYSFTMRRDMPETDLFNKAKSVAKERAPLADLMRHWKSLLLVVGVTIGGTSAFYTYTTYMQKFLKQSVGLTADQTTMVTVGTLIVALIMQPLYGSISDKIGRKPLLIYFGVMGTLFTYPLLNTIQTTKDPWMAFLLICGGWAIVSGYTSITAIIKAELFPTSVRAMGVGFPYAVTVAVFGGTVDSVAQIFKFELHWEQGFYWYATACIFVSLLVYIGLKDTKKTSRMDEAH